MRALLALLLLCTAPALFAAAPARIEATYDVLGKGIKLAVIKETFTRSGNRYHIESITKPVGLLALFKPGSIIVTSEGFVTKEGLRPLKFVQNRTQDSAKNSAADFDWENDELTSNDQAGVRTAPLPPGTQDRLSVMYQFAAMPPRGKLELKLNVANGSKLNVYQYQIHPEQSVTVPLGTLRSLYLYTLPQSTPWKSEIWLAVENGYVPCKVVLTEDNGDKVVQVLTALSITQ
ncbi:MAG TPA: DUF3108 domain-containing protein [Sideroxyarcus sp.]|nr:DUF3108 domain-containing protein [Sideroxyarcus sp.]